MSLLKALLLGALLTLVLSALIRGPASQGGGFLRIHDVFVAGHYIHWSWPLFLLGSGLAWGILLLMD